MVVSDRLIRFVSVTLVATFASIVLARAQWLCLCQNVVSNREGIEICDNPPHAAP